MAETLHALAAKVPTMKAAVYEGKRSIVVKQVPAPRILNPHDAILRVTATTICGSDLHLYNGEIPEVLSGDILGHEFMGIIQAVGDAVSTVKPGDRVVVSFNIACGTCEYCKRKEFTACDNTNPSKTMETLYGHRTAGLFGYAHITGGYPGGQAEYVRIPFADNNVLKIPATISDEKALYLSDIVCTGWHGAECARVGAGDTVVIWGCGPVGIMAAKMCQLRGASRIVMVDKVQDRLNFAKKHVDCETINFSHKDTLEAIKELIPGGPDCAIDACGFRSEKSLLGKFARKAMVQTDSCQVLEEAIIATRKFGRIAIIGDYVGKTNNFPIGALMEKSLQIAGGQTPCQRYWKDLLDLVESGALDPSFIITHRMSLDEIGKAYKMFNERSDGCIKVFLRPRGFVEE